MIAGGGMGMMATGMMGGVRSNYGGDGTYMVRHACATAPRMSIPVKQTRSILQYTLAAE